MDKILNGMILFKFTIDYYYEKYSSFSELNQVWDKKKTFKTQTLVTNIHEKLS
jgi:hypothetical protein